MNRKANSLILDKSCLEAARKQFCLDIGLPWEEYSNTNKVFIQKSEYEPGTLDIASKGARSYGGRNAFFRAIICLGQLFITCDESIYDWVVEQYSQSQPEWFCAYDNLRRLDEKLREHGHRIADTHVYFLPEEEKDAASQNDTVCGEESQSELDLVWYSQEEILRFKEHNRFTSAICFWEKQPDVLAVVQMKDWGGKTQGIAAKSPSCQSEQKLSCKDFDQTHMAGMAGASLDGAYLWQIGINVEEECAGQGIAYKLVRAMKEKILKLGKVPFYGTSESHTISQTVGLKAGFVPAWTEVFVEAVEAAD